MENYYGDGVVGFDPNDHDYSDEIHPINHNHPYANLEGAYAHAEEDDDDYETVGDDEQSEFEPEHDEDAEGEIEHEDYDESIHEPMEGIIAETASNHNKRPKMPLPPVELLHSNPSAFLFQFMFLPRPVRTPDHQLEFWALFWEPITDAMRMHGCEFLSIRLVAVMNENAELERRVKKTGSRRTKVLTDDVYSPITIKLMTREQWDNEDVIWCICEGMKKYPKEVNKNKRFRERLGMSIPERDDLGDASRHADIVAEAEKKKAAIEAAADKKATAKKPAAEKKSGAKKAAPKKSTSAGKAGGRVKAAASSSGKSTTKAPAKASSSSAAKPSSSKAATQKTNPKSAAATKDNSTTTKRSNKRVMEPNSDDVSTDNTSPKKKPCTPNTKAGRNKTPFSTPRGRRSTIGKDETAGKKRGIKQEETPRGKDRFVALSYWCLALALIYTIGFRIPADWCDDCYPESSDSEGGDDSEDEDEQM